MSNREFFQYHLECPKGDPTESLHDSDGKKRSIHQHHHHKLAIQTIQPPTAVVGIVNLSLTSSQASQVVEPDSLVHTESSNLLSKTDRDIDLRLSSIIENSYFYPFLQKKDIMTNKFVLGS